MKRTTLILEGILAAAAAAILLAGCKPPAGLFTSTRSPQPTSPGYTSFFQPSSGSQIGAAGTTTVKFYSTDSSYQGSAGYSFWMFGTTSGSVANSGGIEMEADVDKISGYASMGYGIIFAVQPGGADFYVLLIDTEGNYELGKVTDRVFTPMGQGWTAAPNDLKSGYNQINDIKIAMTGTPSDVTIVVNLNGTAMGPIQDTSAPYSSGAYGFIVTTAPDEPSATNPVDVRFGPVQPTDLGLQ